MKLCVAINVFDQIIQLYKYIYIYIYIYIYSVDRTNILDLKRGPFYYMEESVLLGTKPLVDSIRHFIRDPRGVLSVCHVCECRIVQ